jgi:hypothetical protein
MRSATRTGHRTATAAVLLVAGGAVAAATWVSGERGMAIGLVAFYVVAAGVAYVWSGGTGDVAAIMRVGGDERQRSMDRDATAIVGLVMSVAAIVGVIVQTARGASPDGYGLMCVVGGITYTVSLIALRRRR